MCIRDSLAYSASAWVRPENAENTDSDETEATEGTTYYFVRYIPYPLLNLCHQQDTYKCFGGKAAIFHRNALLFSQVFVNFIV